MRASQYETSAGRFTSAAKEPSIFSARPKEIRPRASRCHLSLAPKSNAVYTAYGNVLEDVQKTEADPVPLPPSQRANPSP